MKLALFIFGFLVGTLVADYTHPVRHEKKITYTAPVFTDYMPCPDCRVGKRPQ